MKSLNLKMLGFALATVLSFAFIGISVAERSISGIIISLLLTVFIAGFGFKTKKKLRESGKL